MSKTSFTIDQIARLREIERDNQARGEPGLYEPLEELIGRLKTRPIDRLLRVLKIVLERELQTIKDDKLRESAEDMIKVLNELDSR